MGWRALAVAAAAAASDCTDEPLWLDGARAACDAALCGDWFCGDCPFAGACDRTCGLCDLSEPCAGGEARDCDGRCTTDAPKSDGCCEPRFNCASHDFDGGDCEPPANEEAPARLVYITHVTVCPPSAMTHRMRTPSHGGGTTFFLESYAASSKRRSSSSELRGRWGSYERRHRRSLRLVHGRRGRREQGQGPRRAPRVRQRCQF